MRYQLFVTVTVASIVLSRSQAFPLADARSHEWAPPMNLGPVVNSRFADHGPAISKDGRSLYFSSNRPGGLGDFDIWVSQRGSTDEAWAAPVNLGNIINTEAYEAVPSLSRDGHWLLFHSTRPEGAGGWDIWMSWRSQVHDDFGWQPPVNLGGVNTPYDDSGARLFQGDSEVTLYFNSTRPGGMGFQDMYTSTLGADGKFGPAVPVTELNSPAFDNRVAISFDGLELFISSNRPATIGDQDLWTSTRRTIFDPWSEPVNLGSAVNTAFSDFTPEVSRDGRELYFASNRPDGEGGFDLYVSRRQGHP